MISEKIEAPEEQEAGQPDGTDKPAGSTPEKETEPDGKKSE